MGTRFMAAYGNVLEETFAIDNNLFFNNGVALPTQETDAVVPGDDSNRVVADPLLETDHSGIVLPVWSESNHEFPSGNTTIREEFLMLVNTYGALGDGSPAINAANPVNMPPEDILGLTRDLEPDIGAFEYGATIIHDGDDDDDDDGDGAPDDGSSSTTASGCSIGHLNNKGTAYSLFILILILLNTLFLKKSAKD